MRALIASFGVALLLGGTALAECVDINADSSEQLIQIVHIDAKRASQIIDGRPWPGVRSLTGVRGIGQGRVTDILSEGLACAGVRAPRGERETIQGIATVLDADTLQVAGTRVRLIGIDSPEGAQMCQADVHEWPCGQVATAAAYEIVGTDPVSCEVYGYDRWDRALAECFQNGRSLNAELVRQGWALAWYPERGAVLGPRFVDDQQEAAAAARAGIWRGSFVEPWVWRQGQRVCRTAR